jgi:hypothetical protein
VADSYIITNRAGSQVDVGSWLLKDPGPDFGDQNIVRAAYADNPLTEGVQFAYEETGLRTMTFPLRVASSSMFSQGLTGAESFLRGCARPGAYIDLKPDGVATGDMVRFDILFGRYDTKYHLDLQKLYRREGTLVLDVEPFGYSPSTMQLASAASSAMGGLAMGTTAIGDAPGTAEVHVQPTVASAYVAGWVTDMVGWSLAGKASFVALIPGNQFTGGGAVADGFAPGGISQQFVVSRTLPWTQLANETIPIAVEPAYRGRFRVFGFARWVTNVQTVPFYLAADAAIQLNAPFASWSPVATLYHSAGFAGSPAHQILDFGEISLPPVASGVGQDFYLRLWAAAPTQTSATPVINFGGMYLLPLDGPAGILYQTFAQPALSGATAARAVFTSAPARRAVVAQNRSDLATYYPLAAADPNYRGVAPYVAASTVQLDMITGQRKTVGSYAGPVALNGFQYAAARVGYNPRFFFLKAI